MPPDATTRSLGAVPIALRAIGAADSLRKGGACGFGHSAKPALFINRDGSRTMDRSFGAVDRQLKSTEENHWQQVPIPGALAEVKPPQLVPALVVGGTYKGCLIEAVRHSELDDHEVAEAIHVSAGYFSRFIKSVGQQQAKRLVAFMRSTNSLAPLQWLAEQMGCELAHRATATAELAAARAYVAELERRCQGRAAA